MSEISASHALLLSLMQLVY